MAFQLERIFELIDPSTFDSAAALREAAAEYYRDPTFDGDDEWVDEDGDLDAVTDFRASLRSMAPTSKTWTFNQAAPRRCCRPRYRRPPGSPD